MESSMAKQVNTKVLARSESEVQEVLRTSKVFKIFNVRWWEVVYTNRIANDVYIETGSVIRNVYLNGEIINHDN